MNNVDHGNHSSFRNLSKLTPILNHQKTITKEHVLGALHRLLVGEVVLNESNVSDYLKACFGMQHETINSKFAAMSAELSKNDSFLFRKTFTRSSIHMAILIFCHRHHDKFYITNTQKNNKVFNRNAFNSFINEYLENNVDKLIPENYIEESLKNIDKNNIFNQIVNFQKKQKLIYNARQGDRDAQFTLGKCLLNGDGFEKNLPNALKYFEEAAQNKHPDALFELAIYYEKKEEFKKSDEYYKLADQHGHIKAHAHLHRIKAAQSDYELGCCYQDGAGVTKNPAKAFQYFKSAADRDHLEAKIKLHDPSLLYRLAACYEKGDGTEKNLEMALKYYKKAASKDHKKAQFKLAAHYEMQGNFSAAFTYYKLAAEHGHIEAQFRLMNCYEYGELIAGKNPKEAFKCCKLAADQGHIEAQFRLATYYQFGKGVEKNEPEAVERYHHLADNYKHSGAAGILELCYQFGALNMQENQEMAKHYKAMQTKQ